MSVNFRILPDLGLVYVRYEGLARVHDGFAAFAAYMRDPDCRPGQKQLVDLSAVTAIDKDFAQIMALQAFKADQFVGPAPETLLVYYAPTQVGAEMARLSMRSWDGFSHVVARVMDDEARVMEFLGLRVTGISAMLAQAG